MKTPAIDSVREFKEGRKSPVTVEGAKISLNLKDLHSSASQDMFIQKVSPTSNP